MRILRVLAAMCGLVAVVVQPASSLLHGFEHAHEAEHAAAMRTTTPAADAAHTLLVGPVDVDPGHDTLHGVATTASGTRSVTAPDAAEVARASGVAELLPLVLRSALPDAEPRGSPNGSALVDSPPRAPPLG